MYFNKIERARDTDNGLNEICFTKYVKNIELLPSLESISSYLLKLFLDSLFQLRFIHFVVLVHKLKITIVYITLLC